MNDNLVKLFTAPNAKIKDAMKQMALSAEKILIVVDKDQHLLGTLTDGDIRRFILKKGGIKGQIDQCYRKTPIFLQAGDTRDQAKRLMIENKLEAIPVVDKDNHVIDILIWTKLFNGRETHVEKIDVPVVIMAGGKGVRLDPFTKILPKPLIPLGEKPIVEVIMDRYYKWGFYKFILVINHKKEMIKLYFSENSQPYEIELIEEDEYCGTVGGLYLLKAKIRSTFVLTNCDTLLEGDYGDFLNWHIENKNLLTIIGSHKEVAVPYGVLSMNNGALIKMVEKPKFDLFVNTGTYVMDQNIFNYLHDNESMDIDKLITKLQSKKANKVGVFPCWGKWFDIGQWDEYKKTLKSMGIEN